VRYIVCTIIGAALMAFSLTALGYGIYQLLQVGTCATNTNTPYDVARECPGGIGWLTGMIPGGLIGLFIGAGIYTMRGRAPGSDKGPNHALLGVWIWTGIFWSIAAACLLGIWGPDAEPGQGGKLGGLIVAVIFIPMGAMGLAGLRSGHGGMFGLGNLLGGLKGGGGSSGFGGMPGMGELGKLMVQLPGVDPVSRIQTLQALREQGAIDDAEFEKLKKQAIGDS
jgi:putative oligomerization/nucleic acid binding protein